ncbi:MAG: SIR2 family protein [Thermoanaerobaculia bacterium]
MPPDADFTRALERQVAQQFGSQRVGYLLGAGSSYLNGRGYPLADRLWDLLKSRIPDAAKRAEIQAKLDGGARGLEQALDLLDDGGADDTPYRHLVITALAELFMPMTPPLDAHRDFVRRIAQRADPCIPVFSLNYDPLLERAAERERARLIDGFLGHEHAFFNAAVFSETFLVNRGPRAKATMFPAGRPIHLYKLHGSLGWYDSPTNGVCRCGFSQSPPAGALRLMVPPQRRKASDVVKPPYSPLWTAFRGAMSQDARPLNRLVTVGYGFRDEHVNDVIDSALVRSDFTLLIFAKDLHDSAWARWSTRKNAVVVTEARCALKGQTGPGHADLWSFERLAREV